MSDIDPAAREEADISRAIEIATRLGVLFLLAAWCFDIIKIFIGPVAWGIIIAIASYSPFQHLKAMLGDRNRTAAAVFVVIGLLILIVPSVMLSETLVGGGADFVQRLGDDRIRIPPPPDSVAGWPIIGDQIHSLWNLASQNLQQALTQFQPQLKSLGLALLAAMGSAGLGLLQFVAALIVAGMLLAGAEGSRDFAHAFARRLAGERGDELATTAGATVTSVASGILGVSLIQAILGGLGFVLVDLPGAGVWALVVLLFAVVQMPVMLVMIGIIAYVFTYASTPVAVVFAIWSTAVGLLDNFLKPILFGRGVKVPILVIFVGAIGGMASSGIIGLFTGSVILAVGYEIFRVWLFRDDAEEPSAVAEAKA
jgi:predicted PurR-regulated permease PerM